VTTTEGSERADVVVVTVPLGVLQAGAIRFTPGLPASKTLAIESLGSGLLNKCVLRFDHARWPAGIEIFNRLSADSGQWAEWVNMAAYGAGPVLMGFNAGSFARQLERASDAETGQLAMEALRSMFGSRMPEHTGVQITRWASNEHALGSYSFPCAATRWDTRIRLAEPVDNRIFFAGEATSTNAPGSVHGAIRSGRAAAVAVVER
jgi:monoamine oxidase